MVTKGLDASQAQAFPKSLEAVSGRVEKAFQPV